MKKAKQPFHGFYMLKTHTCRFCICSSILSWLQNFHAHLKRKRNKFQVSIYSVKVCQVKLSQTKIFSKLAYLEQSTSFTNKTRYIPMVHKRTICGKRAGFPFFIKKKKNIEVIIFPQAQWKMRAKGTDSGNRGNWLAQFKFTFLSILWSFLQP